MKLQFQIYCLKPKRKHEISCHELNDIKFRIDIIKQGFFHYNGIFPPGHIFTKTVFISTKIILKVYIKLDNITWIEPKISFKGSS